MPFLMSAVSRVCPYNSLNTAPISTSLGFMLAQGQRDESRTVQQ